MILKIKQQKKYGQYKKTKRNKKSQNTNEQIKEIYCKAVDLKDLIDAKIVIKAAEKNISNTENLIKKIRSKKRITKETENKIRNLNKRFKIANNNI